MALHEYAARRRVDLVELRRCRPVCPTANRTPRSGSPARPDEVRVGDAGLKRCDESEGGGVEDVDAVAEDVDGIEVAVEIGEPGVDRTVAGRWREGRDHAPVGVELEDRPGAAVAVVVVDYGTVSRPCSGRTGRSRRRGAEDRSLPKAPVVGSVRRWFEEL